MVLDEIERYTVSDCRFLVFVRRKAFVPSFLFPPVDNVGRMYVCAFLFVCFFVFWFCRCIHDTGVDLSNPLHHGTALSNVGCDEKSHTLQIKLPRGPAQLSLLQSQVVIAMAAELPQSAPYLATVCWLRLCVLLPPGAAA